MTTVYKIGSIKLSNMRKSYGSCYECMHHLWQKKIDIKHMKRIDNKSWQTASILFENSISIVE